MSTKRGFTLIEILVVLTIVIVLATIASMVVFNFIDRARITRALVFERQLLDTMDRLQTYETKNIGPVLGLPYDNTFNNASLAPTANVTMVGVPSIESDCIHGNCLFLDSIVDEYIDYDYQSTPLATSKLTAMAWIKMTTDTPGDDIVVQYTNILYSMVHGGGNIAFNVNTAGGSPSIIGGDIRLNRWHHIAMIYNHEIGRFIAYVDGISVGEIVSNGILDTSGAPTTSVGTGLFKGYIDNLFVFYNAPDEF